MIAIWRIYIPLQKHVIAVPRMERTIGYVVAQSNSLRWLKAPHYVFVELVFKRDSWEPRKLIDHFKAT